jgi:hypothetical protein
MTHKNKQYVAYEVISRMLQKLLEGWERQLVLQKCKKPSPGEISIAFMQLLFHKAQKDREALLDLTAMLTVYQEILEETTPLQHLIPAQEYCDKWLAAYERLRPGERMQLGAVLSGEGFFEKFVERAGPSRNPYRINLN